MHWKRSLKLPTPEQKIVRYTYNKIGQKNAMMKPDSWAVLLRLRLKAGVTAETTPQTRNLQTGKNSLLFVDFSSFLT